MLRALCISDRGKPTLCGQPCAVCRVVVGKPIVVFAWVERVHVVLMLCRSLLWLGAGHHLTGLPCHGDVLLWT
jgi:hypothetical protein